MWRTGYFIRCLWEYKLVKTTLENISTSFDKPGCSMNPVTQQSDLQASPSKIHLHTNNQKCRPRMPKLALLHSQQAGAGQRGHCKRVAQAYDTQQLKQMNLSKARQKTTDLTSIIQNRGTHSDGCRRLLFI